MAINIKLAYFSFFVFLVGVILTYLISLTHGNLSDKCISNQVQTGMNILLMLSVMMAVIPLIQLVCHIGCGCPQSYISYVWIVLMIISILIIVVASIVLNGLTGDCDENGAKQLMTGLIIVACVILVITVLPRIFPNMMKLFKSNVDSNDYYSAIESVKSTHPEKISGENIQPSSEKLAEEFEELN